jgi:hypothetical protein
VLLQAFGGCHPDDEGLVTKCVEEHVVRVRAVDDGDCANERGGDVWLIPALPQGPHENLNTSARAASTGDDLCRTLCRLRFGMFESTLELLVEAPTIDLREIGTTLGTVGLLESKDFPADGTHPHHDERSFRAVEAAEGDPEGRPINSSMDSLHPGVISRVVMRRLRGELLHLI